AVAQYLNVPVVIVRRDNKVTEGSTVSINYVSGSSKRIQTMYLSKRSLAAQSRVLIIDDFMKAGGTINGMLNLIREFQCEVAGVGVLVESEDRTETLVTDYISLFQLGKVNEKERTIAIERSDFLPMLEHAHADYLS
ncbi:MAG: phosphoribosyltransferase family protein, partial [Bacilli bacterium]